MEAWRRGGWGIVRCGKKTVEEVLHAADERSAGEGVC